MLLYREWAHYLFPEAKASDFITKVRKEFSSKNMKPAEASRVGLGLGLGWIWGSRLADSSAVKLVWAMDGLSI